MDIPDAVEAIRPSIYQISIYRGLPSDSIVLGTGFQVAPEYLVTAKHVTDPVSDLIAQQGGWLAAGMAIGNMDSPVKMRASFTIEAASIVDTDADNDLSLLRLRFRPRPFVQTPSQTIDITAGTPVSLDVNRPNEGEGVGVSGYPLHEAAMVTNVGIVASSWAVADKNNNQGINNDRYLGNFTTNPADSGAPVFRLSDQRVIGVCVGGKLTAVMNSVSDKPVPDVAISAGLTVIVPAPFVVDLLNRNGITYT